MHTPMQSGDAKGYPVQFCRVGDIAGGNSTCRARAGGRCHVQPAGRGTEEQGCQRVRTGQDDPGAPPGRPPGAAGARRLTIDAAQAPFSDGAPEPQRIGRT